MKMVKHCSMWLSALLLLSVAGCNLQESVFEPESPAEELYKVSIYSDINQQPASKVTTDGFSIYDEVGVYLVNYNGEEPGTLKVSGNQADNVRFTYNYGDDWVPEYDIYYKDNDTHVDFYGYYPYANPSSIEAYPFEVARDQSKLEDHGQMGAYEASDFLWAKTANVAPTESKILLSFQHKMSSARIRFAQGSGWADAAEFAAVTKQVLVTNTVRSATINLATGDVTPSGEVPLTGIVPMNDNGEFRAIVVPQTVAAGKSVLVITVDGRARHYVRDVDTEYLPGKITTYDLNISKKQETGEYEIELSGVSITAWEADNVSHGDDAREYVVIHNAVAGLLGKTITERYEMDPTKIKNLKIIGRMSSDDYKYIRENMTALQRINLKEVESLGDDYKYSIPFLAFSGMSTLLKCVLPDKIYEIGACAFEDTSLAGSIILPEGLQSIGNYAFENTNITNISFPSTLRNINKYAFQDCEYLLCEVKFPESLYRIDENAFYNSGIQGNLILPDGLQYIGKNAFSGCSGLTGSLVIPHKITEIAERAFNGAGFNGTLTLPKGLTSIGDNAFSGVGFKGELVIPESVESIGASAFSSGLYNGTLVLPKDLILLGESAFYNCSRLSGIVEIPENIISIPNQLFYKCSSLEGVRLHKYVESIGSGVFQNCYNLNSIKSEAKNPPTVSSTAFNGVAKDNFTLEVPEASVATYRNASLWKEFKRISAYRDFSISRSLLRTLNASYSKTFVLRAPAGESWSIESKPSWVSVSPMSGTGKTEVTVTTSYLPKGSGKRSGQVSFLLDGKDYRSTMTVEQYDYTYGDGDVVTLKTASKGAGVNVVIMGDCFDAKDISDGKYLQAIRDASGYLLDVEPYLTYKDYFNIYGVFGMSPDSGVGTVNTIREARFGTQYSVYRNEKGGRVSPDFDATFEAACLAPISNDISRTLIIMIENTIDYEGVCYMWGDGSAVAIVPMSTDPAPYDFRGVLHHEAGGHGFGKLADEYIYHNAFIQSCTCNDGCPHVDEFNQQKSYGFYENVSLSGNMHDVPWSHMIFDPQFSNIVDIYEGAYMHARGVFRSEPNSCMHNNIPYFNAISREAIVRRIKKYAGEAYSYEEFKANDRESLPATYTKSGYLFTDGEYRTSGAAYQYPPVFMGEKPSFRK